MTKTLATGRRSNAALEAGSRGPAALATRCGTCDAEAERRVSPATTFANRSGFAHDFSGLPSTGTERLQRKVATRNPSEQDGDDLTVMTYTPCERLPLQRKLAVGAADDPLEHEADRAAERVMGMAAPPPQLAHAPAALQRKCQGCEDEDAQRKLQRRADGAAAPARVEAPPIVGSVLRATGSPLDTGARAFFEPRFGRDFSRVRVHADSRAAQSAQAVNAIAFTVGHDIVFASGRYAPGTHAGQHLLAHELAHVVQQTGDNGALQRQADDALDAGTGDRPQAGTVPPLDPRDAGAGAGDITVDWG